MGKQVNATLKEMCTSLGFVYRRRENMYIKQYSANVISTVSFMIASYQTKGHRLIAPLLGVIYEDVEKLVREIAPSRFKEVGYENTISEHIGYVMPIHDWKEWDFVEPGTNSDILINDLKNSIKEYTDTFSKRYSNIQDAIALADRKSWNPCNYSLFKRLPIMYYILGYKQMGIDFINKTLSKDYCEADRLFTEEYISNYMNLP